MNRKLFLAVVVALALSASHVSQTEARSKGNVAFSGVPTQTLMETLAQGEYFFRKCNHYYSMPRTLARNVILKRELADRMGVYAMAVSLSETNAVLENYMRAKLGGIMTLPRNMCKVVADGLEKDI